MPLSDLDVGLTSQNQTSSPLQISDRLTSLTSSPLDTNPDVLSSSRSSLELSNSSDPLASPDLANGSSNPISLLWRDYASGANTVWFMGGTNNTVMTSYESLTPVPTDWRIEGVADFNNDSRPDLLWRNYATGANTVWFMGGTNNTVMTSYESLTPVPTNWQVIPFQPATVSPQKPDLVIQSQYVPSSATVGDAISISAYTKNTGSTTAGSSYVRYWLSDDTTLNTSTDRFLNYNSVGSLSAGSSEYDSLSFTYDATWGTGTKYILFEADGYGYVAESNEANNVAYQAITINAKKTIPTTYLPFDASKVFSLNSNPGANQTIYLDFDGHVTTNTLWNTYTQGNSLITPAFDMDGNTSNFSTTELETIWRIWQRVAEDFIPFNVNITTTLPSTDKLIKSGSDDTQWGLRTVIGGDNSWYGEGGGVAYPGSFNWDSDTPAFAFSQNLNGFDKAKIVAEAITHEVGHTLGLGHDGTSTLGYYYGHGSGVTGWAPIMGVGYAQEVTQWSKGEYADANNSQDDLAIITTQNGFGYRVDDYGNQLSNAASLQLSGSLTETYGIIETNTDIDWFSFTSSTGSISLNIKPFVQGPNLDILATLYNSSGQVISISNPTEDLFASFALNLAPGQYYLSLKGTGKGNVNTGYSAYGSLGQYSITGTIA